MEPRQQSDEPTPPAEAPPHAVPHAVPEQRDPPRLPTGEPSATQPAAPRGGRRLGRFKAVLLVLAGVLALLCVGGVGVVFVLYDQATKPNRSAPDVGGRNYLRALLVERTTPRPSNMYARTRPWDGSPDYVVRPSGGSANLTSSCAFPGSAEPDGRQRPRKPSEPNLPSPDSPTASSAAGARRTGSSGSSTRTAGGSAGTRKVLRATRPRAGGPAPPGSSALAAPAPAVPVQLGGHPYADVALGRWCAAR